MMHKSAPALLLLTILSAGCDLQGAASDDRTMDGAYSRYVVEFEHASGLTTARAEFRRASPEGELLRLPRRARVSFNGNGLIQMPEHEGGEHFFERHLAGYFTWGQFRFEDERNRVFDNQAHVRHSVLEDRPLTLHKSRVNWLLIDGDALEPGDAVHFMMIDRSAPGTPIVRLTLDQPGARYLQIPGGAIGHLAPGPHEAILVREYRIPLQQSYGAGGHIEVRYQSQSRSINVSL